MPRPDLWRPRLARCAAAVAALDAAVALYHLPQLAAALAVLVALVGLICSVLHLATHRHRRVVVTFTPTKGGPRGHNRPTR